MANPINRRFDLESLEQRLLLSADGVGVGALGQIEEQAARPEMVVEVEANTNLRTDAVRGEESIFGDFEVDIVFDEAASDALDTGAAEGQNGANFNSTLAGEESVRDAQEESADDAATVEATGQQAALSSRMKVVPLTVMEDEVPTGFEGSGDPMPAILTETLHNANGPPANQVFADTLGSEHIINLNLGNAQTVGNKLVIHEGEILKGTWSSPIDLVVDGGRVSPGNSPGVQNVATFTQLNGEVEFEIASAGGPGVGFDQINVAGLATLGGTARMRITLLGGYVPSVGQTFTIMTWGSHTGEFENYLGTAAIGSDRAFVPSYNAGNLVLTVMATPGYNPVQAQIEDLINKLGTVGNVLDGAGELAEMLPFIGENVGGLVATGSAIQGVLLDKLNDLSGTLSVADVTVWLEGLEGTSLLGYTMHVEGVIAKFGATIAAPFSWEYDIYFTRTDTVSYDLGDDVAAGGTLSAAANGSVTSRFDLDFSFGRDATGFYVGLEELKACINLNTSPSLSLNFSSPLPATATATGTAVLDACVAVLPKPSIAPAGKIYLSDLTNLGNGASSVITNFDWTPTASINVDLLLSISTINFPGGTLSAPNGRLKIIGANLFTADPDVDLAFTGATLDLGLLLPAIQGNFKLNTDGALTFLDVQITQLQLTAGGTRLMNLTGNATMVVGDSIAVKADLTLGAGPLIPNLTLTGGTWHLELNTGNVAVSVPYNGGTATVPAGPYLRVEGDGIGVGFTINPAFTLTGNFVFEKAGVNVVVGASDVEFKFTDGTNNLMSITDGFGGFRVTSAGIAGVLGGTFTETIPVVDVSGTFNVKFNTTGAGVITSFTVNGETVNINVPAGNYLRVEGVGALVEVLGVGLTGNFVFENRETSTGGERVITVAATNVNFAMGDFTTDLVTLSNGSGAFIITNTGVAGTATINYALNVLGVASASGAGTLVINQINTPVNETVVIGAGSVAISVPAGPYLRVETTGATLTVLDSVVTGNFSYEQKTTGDGGEVVALAATNVTVLLKQGGTELLRLQNGSGFFVFNDDGMAGYADGTIIESITDVASLTGTFSLTINTTSDAVSETFTIGATNRVVSVPAGPYLKITGTGVAMNLSFGDIGSVTVTGSFAFEQKLDASHMPEYVKVGGTGVGAVLIAGGITVTVTGAEGGFVIKTNGVAGEVSIPDAPGITVTGLPDFTPGVPVVTFTGSNMKLRLNTTGADVPLTTVSTSATEDVTFSFIGPYYSEYIGVSGSVTANFAGFADMSGELSFELFKPAVGLTIMRLGATDLSLTFGTPGGMALMSFHHGYGGFEISSAGVAGTATLEFQTGFVNVNGTIMLELNTTNVAQSRSWTGVDGNPFSFNLTKINYMRVCVVGHLVLGAVDIPVNFCISQSGGNLIFETSAVTPVEIFRFDSTGTFIPGPYWTSLGITDIDFANPSPEDILTFLQRLGNWFNLLGGSSIFDLELPFTGGSTLGEAVDWVGGFVMKFYSVLVSTEIAALNTNLPATGVFGGSFKIAFGSDTATTTVNFTVDYSLGVQGVIDGINAGILAAGLQLRIEARPNRDGFICIGLKPEEIVAGTLNFTISAGSGHFVSRIGFSATGSSQTISRYTIEGFPQALFDLGLTTADINYDEHRKLYIFPINLAVGGTPYEVLFDFDQDIGPLGNASLTGKMLFEPSLHFTFNLGLDLNAAEVPRIASSQFIPAPSNGRITATTSFKLYLNGSAVPIVVTLTKASTNTNTSLLDLEADLNAALSAAADYTPAGGVPTDLLQFVRFQAASNILVLSAVNEDFDNDGHRDVAEDLNGNNQLDPGEDVDGDGNLDVAEPNWDGDLVLDNQLGLINQIRLTVDKNDVFATELGFGDIVNDATVEYPNGSYESIANSSMKGFFLEDIALQADLKITTTQDIKGEIVFGFLKVSVLNGELESQDADKALAPISTKIGIRDPTTGNERFYLPELMDVLLDVGNYFDVELTGGLYAGFHGIEGKIGNNTVLSGGEISIWIPVLTELTLNENAYNIDDPRTDNDVGIFLTYPEVGLRGGFSFEEISFTDIIHGLQAVVDTLDDFSAFAFLDEKIPFLDLSLHDLVDYAGQLADLVDAVAGGNASNIQDLLDDLESTIETLFHLNEDSFDISFDTNSISYGSGAGSDVLTHTGSASLRSRVTFDPGGDNNAFIITRTVVGDTWNNSLLRIKGDSSVSGNTAKASWDPDSKIITILIDPANTTADAIISAINTQIGANWTAARAGGNDGTGKVRTNAIKFHWNYTAAYADEIPLHLDIAELLSRLGGDNPQVQAFLAAATSILHVEGSGLLNVSASASATLDFGLDLTDPTTVTPFLYDTTAVDVKAKVSIKDLNFEAAIGALGVFIRNGEVVLDYDGKGGSNDPAFIRLGLIDRDHDGRHWFDSSLLSLDSIGITAHAGITGILPLYAPVSSIPIGSTGDANGDGFADNALAVDVPDLVRLLMGDKTALNATNVEESILLFRGSANDLKLTVSAASGLHGVKISFSDTGSVTADYLAGSNEIVFGIDSGVTTAQDLVFYVTNNGINGAPAPTTFVLALVPGNDPVANPSANPPVVAVPNNGSGKLSKVTIAAPDLGDLFADMDLCEIIDSATGPLLDGLDGLLGDIQEGLEEVVLNTDLPLLGDGLKGAATFIDDFRNGLLSELRTRIAAANGSAIGALEDAIKEAFWNTLGPGGLDLLVNADSGNDFAADASFDVLDITLSCDDGLVANLRIRKSLALLDTTQNPIKFDIGVPGFGLKVDGNVVLEFAFDLKLRFGFNKTDGFYLVTTGGMEDPELKLDFSATIPGLHAAGELFFLQLDVSDDPDDSSFFMGGFYVDLKDPNHDGKLTWSELTSSDFDDIIEGELGAHANLNLDIAASFSGDARFPRLLADFHLGWNWTMGDGADDPVVEFNNLRLDLGSFISDVLGPILEEVQKITEPIQPIIDIATLELPVLSELAGKPITFLDLAQAFGYLDPETREFIEQVLAVIEFINSIPTGSGSIYIPLGSFLLDQGEDGQYSNVNPLGNLSNIDLGAALNSLGEDSTASSTQITQTSGFVSDIGSMDNFKLPWLDNPSELFGLFTGQPVRLVEWQMPTFAFEFTYTQKIPIYPPLYAQFGGTIGAYINVGFGFDTYGIQQFIEGGAKDVGLIFDGFYIADFDAEGNERPELLLKGEIFAGVSISIGPVEVGVQGGIGATIAFDLNDVVEDGRVRVSELIANAKQDPRCIFDIHGRLYLFLEAFLKVDLLLFKIDKTWRFGEFTLFEFDITCPEPTLAKVTGTTLYIHVGDRAGDRAEIDTSDGNETFVIAHVEGGATTETVEVRWGDYKQSFSGFDNIVADLGEGNDYIDFTGVLTRVTVNGGAGDDTILLGLGLSTLAKGNDGDDTITAGSSDSVVVTGVQIEGGAGNDKLTGVKTSITIKGGDGSDEIYGTPEADTLDGGGGMDLIYAYGGDDNITGGTGNDTIYADTGRDVVDAGDGNDIVEGSSGDDRITGGPGNDLLYGGDGNDVISGGTGDDQLSGHGGKDLLVGDDFNMAAWTQAMTNNLGNYQNTGPVSQSFALTGLTGSGNDLMVGGGSYDVMFGGDGDDRMFGGNLFIGGETQVIEEDDNDFMDAGRGNDQVYGDDSFGKTGDRITGISIEGIVFHDLDLSNLYNDGDRGLAGVKVQLFKVDNTLFSETVTDSAGRWKLLGLDPLDYYLLFTGPAGYTLITPDAGSALLLDDPAEPDNDSDVIQATHKTPAFRLDYDEAETTITAGYSGDPKLTITSAAVSERGEGQTASAVFTFTLSGPSAETIQLDYHTIDGLALAADHDYTPVLAGLLTFAPGEIAKTVTVNITGDSTYEPHEDFSLVVVPRIPSQLDGVPVSFTTIQTIVNDDAVPAISISDVFVSEPVSGGTSVFVRFTVKLSNLHHNGVTVKYQTTDATLIDGSASDRSARAGDDYVPVVSTTLNFGAGETEKFITVEVKGDSVDEYDEAFYVNLFNATNATIADDRGYGVIVDTDAEVTVAITPAIPDGGLGGQSTTIPEGNSITQAVPMNITLSGATEKTITVRWDTARGTAIADFESEINDYENNAQSDSDEPTDTDVVFTPGGPLTQQINVWVHGDLLNEGNEYFYVNLVIAEDAKITKNHVTVNITDDDAANGTGSPFDVRFARTQFIETETDGPKLGYVTLVRTPGPTQAYAILTITGGTAVNFPGINADYSSSVSRMVIFPVGENVVEVPILILGDIRNENNETITFGLRQPTGAPVSGVPGAATMTIIDDDDVVVTVVYNNGTGVTEGNAGTSAHSFSVQLLDAETHALTTSEKTINFQYYTEDVTAIDGSDYTGTGLQSTGFAPGVNNILIPVNATGDMTAEFREVFRLLVKNVSGAGTWHPYADAVIIDDDPRTVTGFIFKDTNNNGFWDSGEDPFVGAQVTITEENGAVHTPLITNNNGRFSTTVFLGTLSLQVNDTAALSGWEVTTENDSQTVEFDGANPAFEPVGYRFTINFEIPSKADTVGRGGTDDTIFGGPGDDYIDAGWGDDHVVGGHWQTATDSNSPINQGTYNATIIANKGANILDPQTAPIWTVNTSVGAGTASIEGNIFVDTNNSNVQDQGLYTAGEVIVTILDCDGNIVNIMTTKTTGAYKFTGLNAGTYYIQFSLPAGQQFVTPNFGADDTIDSDAEIAGATKPYTLLAGQVLKDVDAGLEDLGTLPVSSSSTVAFAQAEWHVSENDPSHKVVITLVRSNASEAEAIVWFASNGTAVSPTNYIGSQGIVIFQPGETLATFEIEIVPAGILGCTVKDFHLSIRRPTGQPIRGGEASVYIHGGAAPTNSDNDTILAGEDWDVVLGDSGHINSNSVQAASANGQIQDTGGLGHDTMYGNDGPDYLNGQLGNDVIAGGEGNDFVYAGYGNDRIIAELDDDELHGDHGTDRVAGTSPLPYITLDGSGVPGRLTFGKAPIPDLPTLPDPADYVFLLFDIESAELFGTPGNDVFLMKSWNAEAWVFGDDGGDIFHVTNDLPLVSVSTASAAQKFLYKFLFGFNVNANVVLSSGPAYHFGQMEIVWLTGGASANTIDASGYTSPVILEGLGGPDTLIGGSSSDSFRFNTDSPLGTDTVTGNGGIDILDFSAGLTLGVSVDLALFSTQVVNANLSLVITAEDVEAIVGTVKNDDLKGNSLNNILLGGAGDDTLTGRGGNEIYSYDTDTAWGSDTIVETSADIGHDIIDFSATTLQVIKLNLSLVGPQVVTPGNLTLTISGNGIDEVIGGAKNDEIVGNSGANTLRGGLGDDSLYGAAGDDFLDGGPGTDILDGGPDIDSIAAIANSNFTLTDSQLLRNGTDVDTLYSIDNADLTGGASNNVFNLTGWSGNATINGMGGIDTIIFGVDANMTLSTAGSNDVLDIGGGASQFTVSNIERWTLSGGVSNNIILANTYTRAGGYLTISGNGGGDTIIGSPNDDVIFGGPGDDSLSGNGGFDTILGGSGLDIVTESSFTSMLVTSTGLTISRAVTGVETDSLDSIETIVGQGAGGNEFFGFTGFIPGLTSITFAGDAGASDIAGFSWNGTLTATNTTVTMTGAPAINISGMERLILIGGTGNDILDASAFTGITSLGGGDGNDVLVGGNGVDTLVGGEGNDTLSGRGGNDALDGGNGNDTYIFDTDNVLGADNIADSGGIDTLDFSTSALGNTVNLTLLANPVNANLSLSWLAGVSLENIIGGAGADNLTGSAGPNVLTGGGNNDALNGGAGDDTYIFDVDGALGSDTVTDSGGIDTFDFSSTTTAANLSLNLTVVAAQVVNANLTLTLGASVVENVTAGAGNDTITGNGSDNVLNGGAGTDILIGNNGADTLNGGAGNDTLTGGAGNDTYVYNAGVAQGTDTLNDASGIDTLDFSSTFALGVTVDLALTTAQTVQAANLTLTLNSATAFENVIGGGGNDIIRGNSVANIFTGGAGSDTIIGVGAGDSISETRDANFLLVDLTASTASLTIGAEVDALTNIHTAILTGGNSANIIDVRDFTGTATLNGGAGNDTFYGGGGTMNFIGGTGDDTYVFDRSVNSVNTITEGSGLLDDLHDTIMGAGGGLVILTNALLQTPDAAYPNFKIQFTLASTVEHSL